jgi:hypothetical protein
MRLARHSPHSQREKLPHEKSSNSSTDAWFSSSEVRDAEDDERLKLVGENEMEDDREIDSDDVVEAVDECRPLLLLQVLPLLDTKTVKILLTSSRIREQPRLPWFTSDALTVLSILSSATRVPSTPPGQLLQNREPFGKWFLMTVPSHLHSALQRWPRRSALSSRRRRSRYSSKLRDSVHVAVSSLEVWYVMCSSYSTLRLPSPCRVLVLVVISSVRCSSHATDSGSAEGVDESSRVDANIVQNVLPIKRSALSAYWEIEE